MAFRLQVEDLSGAVHLVEEFDAEATIGRGADCDVVLRSTSVSRRHARVFAHLGQFYVEDLGAANGVILNGGRINGVEQLVSPAVLALGEHVIRFSAIYADSPTADSPALVRVDAAAAGSVLPLLGPVTRVGRASTNDIALVDDSVSRHHADIRIEGSSYVVVDNGSSNGTWHNGARVRGPKALSDGDVLHFGDIPTVFSLAPEAVDLGRVRVPQRSSGTARSYAAPLVATITAVVVVGGALAYQRVPAPARTDAAADSLRTAAAAMHAADWSSAVAAYEETLRVRPDDEGVSSALEIARRQRDGALALEGCHSKLAAATQAASAASAADAVAAYQEAQRCLTSDAIAPGTDARRDAGVLLAERVAPPLTALYRVVGEEAARAGRHADAVAALTLAAEAAASSPADLVEIRTALRAARVAYARSLDVVSQKAMVLEQLAAAEAIAPLSEGEAELRTRAQR